MRLQPAAECLQHHLAATWLRADLLRAIFRVHRDADALEKGSWQKPASAHDDRVILDSHLPSLLLDLHVVTADPLDRWRSATKEAMAPSVAVIFVPTPRASAARGKRAVGSFEPAAPRWHDHWLDFPRPGGGAAERSTINQEASLVGSRPAGRRHARASFCRRTRSE